MKIKPCDISNDFIDHMIRIRYRKRTTDLTSPSYTSYLEISAAFGISSTAVRHLILK